MDAEELKNQYNQGIRDFFRANLRGADLRKANLREADLRWANLRGADLWGADLRWANLREADLRWANLREADLRGADLRWVDLKEADLPSPTIVLLAFWGEVSDELCQNLMQYDAWFHQNPKAFENWTINGECPYKDTLYQRSANFEEKRRLFKPGIPPRGFDLMIQVIREKCKDSDYHDK